MYPFNLSYFQPKNSISYHNHHPGTPLAMTDETGAVVWR